MTISQPNELTEPVQIVAHGVELGPEDRQMIRRAADRLLRLVNRIVGLRIVVRAPHRRLHREVVRFAVTIHIALPQGTITVRRPSGPDLLTTVQEAFNASVRRIQDFVRRRWRPPKSSAGLLEGSVSSLFRWEGYGFISDAEGNEVFFDRRSVLDDRFDALELGMPVQFAWEQGQEGPQASSVAARARR